MQETNTKVITIRIGPFIELHCLFKVKIPLRTLSGGNSLFFNYYFTFINKNHLYLAS
jgi:hypothetical protein